MLLQICSITLGNGFIYYFSGLEAPRNSLELPIETSYGLYAARDNILVPAIPLPRSYECLTILLCVIEL